MYTDGSEEQLGAVILQKDKPIAFYSRKRTDTQKRYTTGEQEMFSIVKTLKDYQNILLVHKVIIHTDHLNNTNPLTNHTSKRTQHWRWLIDEFGPEFDTSRGAIIL